jgi:pimeloyl-ACP methyl ester carboxylesterase
MIPSSDPGVKLYVRNKHGEGMTSFSPDKTLLFIHGATYPAETSFDLPIDGVSMMDLFARSGFDVYLVDVRSYGRSTRPPEMDQPPEANKPIATSEEAGADLGAAVDYILAQRGIPKLDLMGWSWGTSIAGAYTANHNDKINRLVLYAPAWISQSPVAPPTSVLPAYRVVAKDEAKARWLKGVPEDKQAALIPPGVFDQWWSVTLATDPVGSKMNPPKLRAGNGVRAEFANYWGAGKPFYDPARSLFRPSPSMLNGTPISRARWRTPISPSSRARPTSGLSSLAKAPIPSCSRRTACSSSTRSSDFWTNRTPWL